jgi:hypothetical protein
VGSSTETHFPAQSFVPVPQDARTQVPAWQPSVPVPAAGHDELLQVVAPQPYVGSSIDTHEPAQFFMPVGHVPTTHAPFWHASAPPPASGHVDVSQVVPAQPYVGSSVETHWSPHIFVPVAHVPTTQAPP